MRKSLLTLALVAGSAAILNAQNAKFSASNSAQSVQAFQKVSVENCAMNPLQNTLKSRNGSYIDKSRRVIKAPANAKALYKFPAGALFYGLSDDGYSFSNIRMLTSAFHDVTFLNYSNDGTNRVSDVTWSWPNNVTPLSATQDEEGNLTAQSFGTIAFPVLTAGNSTYGESFTSDDGETQAFWDAGASGFGVAEYRTTAGSEIKGQSYSNACVQFGFYGGFRNGGSFTTNQNFLTVEDEGWVDTGQKLTGFAELYEKPLGHVYTKDIIIWLGADKSVNPSSPLEGKTLTAQIYTFGADGKPVPYAEATATDADAQLMGTTCLISFKFTEEDPILGDVEAPITLPNEDFMVMLTGFEQLSTSFSALFSPADGWEGHGYAILEDGSLSTIPYIDVDVPQVSLNIGFHAAVPVAELAYPESGVVVAPAEGGYCVTGKTEAGEDANDVGIYTLTESSEWLYDAPEWIKNVTLDETYLERGFLVAFIEADALPAGETGRRGEVVFTLWGKEVKVTVVQGDAVDAITSVKDDAANTNSAIYNISGQKVNKNYKGVVIQNGKKFINK